MPSSLSREGVIQLRKLKALYQNELIKAVKKPIIIVFIILISASMLVIAGFMGLVRVVDVTLPLYDYYASEEDADYDENVNSLKLSLDSALAKMQAELISEENGYYDEETHSFTKKFYSDSELLYSVTGNVSNIMYDLEYSCLEKARADLTKATGRSVKNTMYNSNVTAYDYLFSDLLDQIVSSDANRIFFEIKDGLFEKYNVVKEFDDEFKTFEWIGTRSAILEESVYNRIYKLCTDNDASAVFEYKRELINNDSSLSEKEKKNELLSLDIMKDLYRDDMDYESWHEVTSKFQMLANYRTMLETGEKSEGGQRLTDEEIKNYSLIVEEIETGLRTGANGYGGRYNSSDKQTGDALLQIGIGLAQILVIILGALLVAEDFQSGAIKTLIIAPVKRHRIVSAKLLLLVTVTLVCAIQVFVTYMLAALISGSDFGNNVFVIGQHAYSLGPVLYYLLYTLAAFVPVLFHGCFAFMISTLIRNTGGAIAVSLGTIFMISTSSSVSFIVNLVGSKTYFFRHLTKFLPTSNLSFQTILFRSVVESTDYSVMDILTMRFMLGETNGPLFAFLYMSVLAATFIFISYQSYVKRDVK